MTDISSYLMSAERNLKEASQAVCNGTMTTAELSALRGALMRALDDMNGALQWTHYKRPEIEATSLRNADAVIRDFDKLQSRWMTPV